MAISALIIGLMALIISLMGFLFVGATALSILKENEYLKRSDPSPTISIRDDKDTFEEGFKAGQNVLFNSMQLALFDMYQNFEILDYEEQFNSLLDRISKVVSDKDFREDLVNKFTEYTGDDNDMDNN